MNASSHSFDFAPGLPAILSDARNFPTGMTGHSAQTSVG
jgi:hypothetical protein